jgi:CheY-like chemotaxis protein
MAAKRVLLVGDYAHRDFREALAWLEEHVCLTLAASVSDGLAVMGQAAAAAPAAAAPAADEDDGESVADRMIPDVIVVAQSRPGQFRPPQVERLHAASPLSRLVVLSGSWCEGELRSGRPCAGVIRVLWHQWQPRLVPFLQPGSAPLPDIWSLPRTASLDEQLASTVGPLWPVREGLVAIHAETRETFQALSDACRQGGYATVWYPQEQVVDASGVVAALADGISCGAAGQRFVRSVVQRHRPAPVIVILDFVRRQDYDLARAEGAGAVLAKPFLVYDLLWHLDHTIGQAGGR